MSQVVDHVLANVAEVERLFSELAPLAEPLAPDKLSAVASFHGELHDADNGRVTAGKHPSPSPPTCEHCGEFRTGVPIGVPVGTSKPNPGAVSFDASVGTAVGRVGQSGLGAKAA